VPRSSSIAYAFFRKRSRLPKPRATGMIIRRAIAVSRFAMPVGRSANSASEPFQKPK